MVDSVIDDAVLSSSDRIGRPTGSLGASHTTPCSSWIASLLHTGRADVCFMACVAGPTWAGGHCSEASWAYPRLNVTPTCARDDAMTFHPVESSHVVIA